jgi:hypothetical protein
MSSWVQVKNDLIAFAASHLQINSVGFGDPLAIGTDNTINLRTSDRDRVVYPLLFIDAQSASMPMGATNLTCSVLVMDRVADLRGLDASISGDIRYRWTDNEDEVLSDTLRIMQDFVADFTDDPDKDYTITGSVSATRFVEARDDKVAGWQATVVLELPYSRNVCQIPTT